MRNGVMLNGFRNKAPVERMVEDARSMLRLIELGGSHRERHAGNLAHHVLVLAERVERLRAEVERLNANLKRAADVLTGG